MGFNMAKNICYLITAVMLSGCVTTDDISLKKKEPTIEFLEKYQSNIASLEKYDLFSYRVKTEGPVPMIGYAGRFEWNGKCLAFVSDNLNKKFTPIFPVQTTKINSDGTNFSVSGINFSIGDEVVLGGSFSKASDNKSTLITESNPECLLEETITII